MTNSESGEQYSPSQTLRTADAAGFERRSRLGLQQEDRTGLGRAWNTAGVVILFATGFVLGLGLPSDTSLRTPYNKLAQVSLLNKSATRAVCVELGSHQRHLY